MQTRARTEEQRAERKQKLVDAARKLFNDQGYAGTTVAMITREAGLSTGTFYLYFESKAEVYYLLYNIGIGMLMEQIEGALDPDGSAFQNLMRMGTAYSSFYQEHRDYYRIMAVLHLNQEDLHPDNRPGGMETEANARGLLKRVEAVLTEGMRRGEIQPVDPWKATTFLWGMMDGLLLLEERDNMRTMELDFAGVLEQGLMMIARGILTEKAVASLTPAELNDD